MGRKATMGGVYPNGFVPSTRIGKEGGQLSLSDKDWLERMNGKEGYAQWRKLQRQMKFRPLHQAATPEPIERVETVPVDRNSKFRFSGRSKLKVRGFGPWA